MIYIFRKLNLVLDGKVESMLGRVDADAISKILSVRRVASALRIFFNLGNVSLR